VLCAFDVLAGLALFAIQLALTDAMVLRAMRRRFRVAGQAVQVQLIAVAVWIQRLRRFADRVCLQISSSDRDCSSAVATAQQLTRMQKGFVQQRVIVAARWTRQVIAATSLQLDHVAVKNSCLSFHVLIRHFLFSLSLFSSLVFSVVVVFTTKPKCTKAYALQQVASICFGWPARNSKKAAKNSSFLMVANFGCRVVRLLARSGVKALIQPVSSQCSFASRQAWRIACASGAAGVAAAPAQLVAN